MTKEPEGEKGTDCKRESQNRETYRDAILLALNVGDGQQAK